tara:strand:+ start:1722 stop:2165 length:444 start_codon:yes stop_codon:yes gene_type:complete
LQQALTLCDKKNRNLDPGLVWLSLIPFFNWVWNWIILFRVKKSLMNEFNSRGLEIKIVRDAFVVGLAEMILLTSNIIISIIYFFILIVDMIQMLLENNAEYFNTYNNSIFESPTAMDILIQIVFLCQIIFYIFYWIRIYRCRLVLSK